VANFPGRQMRLFPNFSPDEVQRKKKEYEKQVFITRIGSTVVDLHCEASDYNENILKETLSLDQVAARVHAKLGIEVKGRQLKIEDNLNLFGMKEVVVLDFFHRDIERSFDLTVNLNIIKVEAAE